MRTFFSFPGLSKPAELSSSPDEGTPQRALNNRTEEASATGIAMGSSGASLDSPRPQGADSDANSVRQATLQSATEPHDLEATANKAAGNATGFEAAATEVGNAGGADAVSEIAAATAEAWVPTAALQHVIFAFHSATGLPWWLSIALTTVAMRAIVFPLMLFQIKSAAKQAAIAPELVRMTDRVKAYNYSPEEVQRYRSSYQALMKKHGVNPVAPFVGAMVQASTFIFFYFAIMGLARHVPSMAAGGTLWFTDLSAPDPLYLLPFISALGMLSAVELNAVEGMEMQATAAKMRMFMRGMAVVSVPVTATFPQAVFCYMIPNTAVAIAQGLLLRNKRARALLGLPPAAPTPGLRPGPGPAAAPASGASALGAVHAPVSSARPPLPAVRPDGPPQPSARASSGAKGRRRGFCTLFGPSGTDAFAAPQGHSLRGITSTLRINQ